jgi:hypothetical protein
VAFIAFLIGQRGNRIFYFRLKPINKIHGEVFYTGYEVSSGKMELFETLFYVDNKFDSNALSEKFLLYLHGRQLSDRFKDNNTLTTKLFARKETKRKKTENKFFTTKASR